MSEKTSPLEKDVKDWTRRAWLQTILALSSLMLVCFDAGANNLILQVGFFLSFVGGLCLSVMAWSHVTYLRRNK